MKVVQVLQPQWLSYIYFISIVVIASVVDYASAQQQKQLQDTEVNYTASVTSRFGAEIVVYPVATLNKNNNSTADDATSQQKQLIIDKKRQENKEQQKQQEEGQIQQQQQIQQLQQEKQSQQQQQIPVVIRPANDPLNNNPPSPRVVRRLDETKDPSTQLVVAQQFDVPLVKKNFPTNKSTARTSSVAPEIPTVLPKQRQRSASSRSNSRDSRKSANTTATTTSQRSTSYDSQAPNTQQPTTTRTHSGNAANVTKAQRRRNDDQRGKTAQLRQSTESAVSIDASSGSSVHKSRQEGSAAVKSNARKSTVRSTTTSTSTTSTTVLPPQNFNFIPSNPFSFFSPQLWALSSPPKPSSTKKPPKKYAPTPGVTTTTPAKVKKSGSRKNKVTSTTTTTTTAPTTTTSTTTTTTTKKPVVTKSTKTRTTTIIPAQTTTTTQSPKKGTTDGPFRIALPTFNFFGAQPPKSDESYASEKDKRNTAQNLRTQFNCPRENEVRFQLFPKICKTDGDCSVWNRNELCCEIFGAKSCVSGVIKPLEETSHTPILGLIPRKCPSRPLAELWWQVQECETDTDCWPRVCCPDGNKRYCRTSQPELETVPVPVKRSFNYLSEYLECTPAPPPIFDLHPKTCESTLDCFPNVCCQEAGLRHCRPPKKSLLTWMANILNVDFVKRLAQNIVIK